MAYKSCDDCGCRVYDGLCTNCHEVNYIEDQYIELGMDVPENIYNRARENEMKARLKNKEKERAGN